MARRKEIEGKKTRMLSKMAAMDADDPLYDSMYDTYNKLIRDFISEVASIDTQIAEVSTNIETNGARKESLDTMKRIVSQMWEHLDEMPDDNIKAFLNSFIDSIQVLETPDVISGVKCWVNTIKFKVPMMLEDGELEDTFDVQHIFQPNEGHVETVVLLSKLNAKQHIEVDIDLDELDATAAETTIMGAYQNG